MLNEPPTSLNQTIELASALISNVLIAKGSVASHLAAGDVTREFTQRPIESLKSGAA